MGLWSKVAGFFGRNEPSIATAEGAFVRLMALAPECFEPAPDYDPPRVRIVGWPNDATLHELERCAQPPEQR